MIKMIKRDGMRVYIKQEPEDWLLEADLAEECAWGEVDKEYQKFQQNTFDFDDFFAVYEGCEGRKLFDYNIIVAKENAQQIPTARLASLIKEVVINDDNEQIILVLKDKEMFL